VVARWRRSLQLRVVSTTILLSLVVVLVLGDFLVGRIVGGLLNAKVDAALAESASGAKSVQDTFDAAGRTDPATLDSLAGQLVGRLATGGGPAGVNEVLFLRGPDIVGPAGPRDHASSFAVGPATVSAELRAAVVGRGDQRWQYTSLQHDGQTIPAVAIGSPVVVPAVGTYELYFVFPLDKEQQTIALIRRTLVAAAFGLVLLVGGVAALVTRQVVTPVRMAARISERLAAGRLEERMRVRGEDDLARLGASFNKMATNLQRQIRQLEELSRVQRRFVSDVSHELRTPLTTVRMAADVLHEARTHFDPVTSRSAELLQAELDRFESLLSGLLEISRYDAGAAVLEPEPVDLRALTDRVVDGVRALADRTGTTIRTRYPQTPAMVEADPRRIERILRNLLVNAIEHGEGKRVDVRVAVDETAAAVAVRDHGVGLKPGEAVQVFARFWRADPARARTSGGTGLGLSIAQEDALLHGGWLQAWGQPGAGSNFRLTLPRTPGVELDHSPLPLEPGTGRGVRVGGPYRRIAAPPPDPAGRGDATADTLDSAAGSLDRPAGTAAGAATTAGSAHPSDRTAGTAAPSGPADRSATTDPTAEPDADVPAPAGRGRDA